VALLGGNNSKTAANILLRMSMRMLIDKKRAFVKINVREIHTNCVYVRFFIFFIHNCAATK
jgi:hypothetical protein